MEFENVYFLGIGGIGMSALARYCLHEGKRVAGYDRTPSDLTAALEKEGATISYTDNVETLPDPMRDKATTLVVYTPAIPAENHLLQHFRHEGFVIEKRSQMLGLLSKGKFLMAVSGTHGKTTTTTMTAWFNHEAGNGGSAFLGGISKNFDSNLVLGAGDRLAVEADEFDRSFLQLYPSAAVVTAADADHLDIYGTHEAVKQAFSDFIGQIQPGGTLIIKEGVDVKIDNPKIRVFRYGYDTPTDFYAKNISVGTDGRYTFDIVCPDRTIKSCTLGIPGRINVENCVAAVALVWCAGFDEERLRQAIGTFSGVRRRFDFYINTPQRIYMDDYAHHPNELKATITSVRAMFPGRRLTVVFQPHLYTRTRDFYREFGEVLALCDKVLLLPIYPAREEPIEGVVSEMMLPLIGQQAEVVSKESLIDRIETLNPELLITFGAGDIDRLCHPIAEALERLPIAHQ